MLAPVHILDLFLCDFLVVYFLIAGIDKRVNARQKLPRGRPLCRSEFLVSSIFHGNSGFNIIMADSDDDYVQDLSEEEAGAHQVRGAKSRSKAAGKGRKGTAGGGWEVTRTWENVVESADGTINSTVEEMLEAGKRKR